MLKFTKHRGVVRVFDALRVNIHGGNHTVWHGVHRLTQAENERDLCAG
jgi:hypothetical protein